MAATVAAEPATPASCYRPLRFSLNRTDPAGTLIVEIFIADSTDVSTLGNDLQVGDVVAYYTGTVFGSVTVQRGQTVLLDADMGPYAGVQMVTNAFTDGSDKYMVLDAVDAGDFTPASMIGSFKVWLNNYTFHCRILIYTDPTGAPQTVDLKRIPDTNGNASFDVNLRIQDYFSHRIDEFMVPASGGSIVQNAHGVTALFYRVHLAEVWDSATSTAVPDPYDGTHTILEDDTEDVATLRVAVNAVHPYAGELLDWSSDDMADFVIGDGAEDNYSRKALTNMPSAQVLTQSGVVSGRKITLGPNDRFGIHFLTDAGIDHEVVDYALRIYRISGTPGLVDDVTFDLEDLTSSFRVGIGPADLGSVVDGIEKYSVWVRAESANFLSEPIEITVDSKCKEGSRTFGWLNKLGGVDTFNFRGREIKSSKVKRATIRKPHGAGTGFDYTERQHLAEPERTATVSTMPISKDVRKWLGEDLFESANVNVIVSGRACTCVILTGENVSTSTGPYYKPYTIEYRLGVNNLSQRA